MTPANPNTELWFILYSQVFRADGGVRRNLKLDVRRGWPPQSSLIAGPGRERQAIGMATWFRDEITGLLSRSGLPPKMPLSVLAVETIPEPNGWFRDPLCGDLGQVRILRTSPLTAIEQGCCPVQGG